MNEDTQHRIGTILDETAQRDAIHIAVVPLIAGERLWAGNEVGLAYGTTNVAMRRLEVYGGKPIAIVDPFLKGGVEKGQRFYGFLFPNTVTGMRHSWMHPAFDGPVQKPSNESEAWLHKFADKWNFDYDEMISAALESEGYAVAMGIDLHSNDELAPGDEDLFWQHMETITGRKFDESHRQNFGWSCSC